VIGFVGGGSKMGSTGGEGGGGGGRCANDHSTMWVYIYSEPGSLS
jgi:hypothetical protein